MTATSVSSLTPSEVAINFPFPAVQFLFLAIDADYILSPIKLSALTLFPFHLWATTLSSVEFLATITITLSPVKLWATNPFPFKCLAFGLSLFGLWILSLVMP